MMDEGTGRPSETASHIPDPWSGLRRWTPARIALGRAGGSLPTAALLDFRLAHARAVDAVHQSLDAEAFCARLQTLGLGRFGVMSLTTAVQDPAKYLHRPDLGRVLSDASRQKLHALRCDVVIIIADGLSALAVERQAPLLLAELLPLLERDGWKLAPLMVVRHGRVALEDKIGTLVGASLAVMLIGERPGLVAPDSLGAYLVYDPKPGNTDADRNCVSNIRPGSLHPAEAARKIHYLMSEARRRRISGIHLKDDSGQRLLS